MKQTLVERALNSGGKLTPLIVDNKETGGLGLCNPSIYKDNDEILMNVRNVSYTLHHCEGDMKYPMRSSSVSSVLSSSPTFFILLSLSSIRAQIACAESSLLKMLSGSIALSPYDLFLANSKSLISLHIHLMEFCVFVVIEVSFSFW